MSELRRRQNATGDPGHDQDGPPPESQQGYANNDHGISVLDIIRVFVTLALATLGLSYYITNGESLLWGYRPWFTRLPVVKHYLVIQPILKAPTQEHPLTTIPYADWPRQPHTRPVVPLQWKRQISPHLSRRQRLDLRCLRQSKHVRSRWELQFLRRARRYSRLRDRLLQGGPYAGPRGR